MGASFAVPSRLIRELYAGAIETPPWRSFLHGMRREATGTAALIMLSPPGSAVVNLLSIVGDQPEVSSSYRERLFALEPFLNLPEGQVTTLHEFIGARELRHNAYYNRFMRNWGVGFVLGADVRTAAGYIARLRLCRGLDARDFEPEVHELVEMLLPHLCQAVEIFDRVYRLQVGEVELNDAFDRFGVASFLLDARGRVSQPNRSAAALLACGEGLGMRGGRLVLASDTAQQRLMQLLKDASRATAVEHETHRGLPEIIAIPRGPGSFATAVAVRMPRSPADLRADHAPVLAIYVSQPESRGSVSAELVRELLGVTRAEADLAARLACGATIDEAASALGIARTTARTQLYSIFRKTGLHRQSELVSLIAHISARLPQDLPASSEASKMRSRTTRRCGE